MNWQKTKHFLLAAFTSLLFLIAGMILMFMLVKHHVEDPTHSNRICGFDSEQTFRVAYIKYGTNQVKKIRIKHWQDFPTALNIQLTDEQGIVYLTTYSNVLMISDEK